LYDLVLLGREIPISAFGVFLLVAFFVSIAMARRALVTRFAVDPNAALDLSLYTIIAGIVGGRLGYIAVNLDQFSDPTLAETLRKMFMIWRDSGLVFYGALAAALVFTRLYTKTWKLSFGALIDAYTPPMLVGYAIAMVGALLHGLFTGRATGVPWGVEMFLEHRHPAQLYLAAAAVAILGILRAQRDQILAPGTLFVLAIFLQAVARFVVDFFVDAPAMAGPFTLGQVASGIVALVTVVLLARLQRQAPETLGASEPPAEAPA
jgi:phosphatidylglycerol:prolipoprotein diacylglycerol transferase